MRGPEAHLSAEEVDSLVRAAASAEAQEHLDTCSACRSTLEMHRQAQDRLDRLRQGAHLERGPHCPPEADWLDMAASQVDASQAETLVRHAASCDYCGTALRTAMADFADELSPDEEEALEELESNRECWQRRLVSEMCASQTGRSAGIWARPRIYATAIPALALAIVIGVVLLRPTPVENLLATAYAQQRTLELRIPLAAYGPVRITRGAANASRLDRPPMLLEAEARIAGALQRKPDDPALLQARGRADLLDWNYADAIRSLKRALDLAPSRPGLRTDLASAYYESAEGNQNRASDYAAAIDLLDQALKSNPGDPIALFNQAIVYERMNQPSRAIEAWRRYLLVDSRGDWASEARHRLEELTRR